MGVSPRLLRNAFVFIVRSSKISNSFEEYQSSSTCQASHKNVHACFARPTFSALRSSSNMLMMVVSSPTLMGFGVGASFPATRGVVGLRYIKFGHYGPRIAILRSCVGAMPLVQRHSRVVGDNAVCGSLLGQFLGLHGIVCARSCYRSLRISWRMSSMPSAHLQLLQRGWCHPVTPSVKMPPPLPPLS